MTNVTHTLNAAGLGVGMIAVHSMLTDRGRTAHAQTAIAVASLNESKQSPGQIIRETEERHEREGRAFIAREDARAIDALHAHVRAFLLDTPEGLNLPRFWGHRPERLRAQCADILGLAT